MLSNKNLKPCRQTSNVTPSHVSLVLIQYTQYCGSTLQLQVYTVDFKGVKYNRITKLPNIQGVFKNQKKKSIRIMEKEQFWQLCRSLKSLETIAVCTKTDLHFSSCITKFVALTILQSGETHTQGPEHPSSRRAHS